MMTDFRAEGHATLEPPSVGPLAVRAVVVHEAGQAHEPSRDRCALAGVPFALVPALAEGDGRPGPVGSRARGR
jgi:hypothetical protein